MILHIVVLAHINWVCGAGIRGGCYLNCHCCRNKHSNYSSEQMTPVLLHAWEFQGIPNTKAICHSLALTPQHKLLLLFAQILSCQPQTLQWSHYSQGYCASDEFLTPLKRNDKVARAVQATYQTSVDWVNSVSVSVRAALVLSEHTATGKKKLFWKEVDGKAAK